MIYPDTFERKIGFDSVRSLVASQCVSPLGVTWCEQMSFMTDYKAIEEALALAAEMLSIINGPSDFPLHQLRDVTGMLRRITVPGTFLTTDEVVSLRRSLESISEVSTFMGDISRDDTTATQYPRLRQLTSTLGTFPTVTRSIDRLIDRYGNIKDNASPELASIRQQLKSISGSINSIMRRVMSRAVAEGFIDSDAAPSVRDGRLVIPVAPMHKRKINGIVHDESASGKTIFIEPAEVVEANNRYRELEMDERREINRLLVELANEIRPEIPGMLDSYEVMGQLDFIRAKARFAQDVGGCLPHVSSKPEMEWYHATHPILLLSLRKHGKEIVPLDITLSQKNRLLIISGPNAGGKSVCLKTVGIIQYMTQSGLLPPVYENSHIGLFDDIFIDIGDDQSIEDDLSTYSSHLRNMKLILSKGRGTSLVLIDEFGGGTEPQIGGAIAQAMLKQFNKIKMWGVITTHYQNLKKLAEETPGLINGSMLYDRQQMVPLFRLSIGHAGSSFAIEIARKIGLPREIIDDAAEIVGSDYVNLDKYLLDVARDKRYWENKRDSIKQKEKKLDQVLERYESEAATLREQRREIINDARRQAQQIIEGSNSTVERTIQEIRKAQAEREKTIKARLELQQEKERLNKEKVDNHPLLSKAPKTKAKKNEPQPKSPTAATPIAVGDVVKLDGEGMPGKVLEISGKDAVVAFGMIKTTVKVKRLRHTMAAIPTGAKKSTFVSSATTDMMRDRQLHFKQDIDVRGMRADEAIQAITYFIDDALQFSAKRVRILHGTGTGVLRQVIRQYLDTVPGVESYRDEHVQFGGAGITVVDLG